MRNKQKEIEGCGCRTLFFLHFILLFCVVNLFSQGPDTIWTKTYGGVEWDFGWSVQQTSDGGYIIVGWTESFGAGWDDVYLIKTDAQGNTLWTKTYGGVANDYGFSVQETIDNGYIIVGSTSSYGSGSYDVYLIKTDSNGDTIWTKTYGGANIDEAISVQQTSEGGYIVVGYTQSLGSGDDVYLIKTDSDGDTIFTKRYGGINDDMGILVRQTADVGYIITGYTRSFGAGGHDVYLMKTDANGDTLWTKTYGGTTDDYSLSVQKTSDGGYIITGSTRSFGAGLEDVYLLKTDTNGNLLWSKTYGGTGLEAGRSVQQTVDGGYIIGGCTSSFGAGGYDVYLIKTDEYGDTLWTKTYGWVLRDEGFSVLQTDGCYIVAGYTYTNPYECDVWLIKTDPLGELIWQKTYGGAGFERGRSVQETFDGGYIIAGSTTSFGAGSDFYLIKTDQNGETEWTKTCGGVDTDYAKSVQQTTDGGYIVAGYTQSFGTGESDVWLIRLAGEGIFTNDPLSLAYNGNRHLVREPNTDNLHLVYTDAGKVWYRYSDNGGVIWTLEEEVGEGNFPAIAVSRFGGPSVTWTATSGALLFKTRRASGFPPAPYIIYNLTGTNAAEHPSMVITSHPIVGEDTVHILSRTYQGFLWNAISELSFPGSNPGIITERILDYASDGTAVFPHLDFPSIARTSRVNAHPELLHGVWMHGDTVYYATREIGGDWDIWGRQFGFEGLKSDHPFVETYGDSVFVVWQHRLPMAPEEVYKGKRHLLFPGFRWYNISNTPFTESVYPVNASGLVSVFADEAGIAPSPEGIPEIYWTTNGVIHNLSNTPPIKSIFPQSSLRYTEIPPTLYTVWQEGNSAPYEIICSRTSIRFPPGPFYTSGAGSEVPSYYLVERDSFIPDWEVPVDVGYETIKYQFHLDPIYRYYLKAIAYHESEGKWKEWLKIDKKKRRLIKYEAYEPETLGFWIPTGFYKDSIIDVDIERIKGDFAAIGPIYIYRYEYEEESGGERLSGGMTSGIETTVNRTSLNLSPNPFRDRVKINFVTPKRARVKASIYDVTGRLVKKLYDGESEGKLLLDWKGETRNRGYASTGIYFLRVENLDSKEVISRKLIKIK